MQKTTQTRVFHKDLARLNAMKERLQDNCHYSLTHPFLIMMLLDEWEKRNSTEPAVQVTGASVGSSEAL